MFIFGWIFYLGRYTHNLDPMTTISICTGNGKWPCICVSYLPSSPYLFIWDSNCVRLICGCRKINNQITQEPLKPKLSDFLAPIAVPLSKLNLPSEVTLMYTPLGKKQKTLISSVRTYIIWSKIKYLAFKHKVMQYRWNLLYKSQVKKKHVCEWRQVLSLNILN